MAIFRLLSLLSVHFDDFRHCCSVNYCLLDFRSADCRLFERCSVHCCSLDCCFVDAIVFVVGFFRSNNLGCDGNSDFDCSFGCSSDCNFDSDCNSGSGCNSDYNSGSSCNSDCNADSGCNFDSDSGIDFGYGLSGCSAVLVQCWTSLAVAVPSRHSIFCDNR